MSDWNNDTLRLLHGRLSRLQDCTKDEERYAALAKAMDAIETADEAMWGIEL